MQEEVKKRKRDWLYLLLGLALVRGLIYAALVPPWQAPDETGHFEYAWTLVHLGRIPAKGDTSASLERELLASLYEWRYGSLTASPLPEETPLQMSALPPWTFARLARTVLTQRFSLSYAWQALFLLALQSQDLALQLFVARLSSVLLNVGIVYLSFLTFCELFPSRREVASLATAVVIFMPQHTFINSMVGDGTLAELMAALAIYCWARLFGRGFGIREVLGVFAGTLIGIWSKRTASFLIPASIGLALWWILRRPQHLRARRRTVYLCAGIVLSGLSLWMWSRSSVGTRTIQVAQRFFSSPALAWVDRRGMTLGEALLLTHDSFWANFGWMTLPISERWYGAMALLFVAALCGWSIKRPQETATWSTGMMGGILGIAFLGYVWAQLLSRESDYYQFQGRYLFPALIPLVFFLVGGLERLWPVRKSRLGVSLFLSFLVVWDAWCLAGYLLPYFYA